MPLSVTALYAGLLGLLVVALALRVALRRMRGRIAMGDGGDVTMQRAIRGHANAVETIPLGLILIAVSEASGAPDWGLHLIGLMLTLGRALHAWHFCVRGAPLAMRTYGMILTLLALAGASAALLVLGVSELS